MIYNQDIENAFEQVIGEYGAKTGEFAKILEQADAALAGLSHYKFLKICDEREDFTAIEEAAKNIRDNFLTLVVLGMGASSRGGKTLVALTENPFACNASPKIHFVENIDPFTFEQLLNSLDFKNTMFLVISKSGGTAETLAQLSVLLAEVELRLGKHAIKKHFTFITELNDSVLSRIANLHEIKIIEHDKNIGGRFAALTAVGLLPAKVAGVDIDAIRSGASEIVKHTFANKESEPAKGAALSYVLNRIGKNVSVMMPYCDRLDAFGAWHQQLWAESLGKNGNGTTALRAIGAFDQHSQLQLYLDGPKDKFITLLLLEQAKTGANIPPSNDSALAYLQNHTIGDLMAAEQLATCKTLIKNNCPIRTFSLKTLDEYALGSLMMHFMLETVITAALLGINAFDQPAVEESKQLARQYLSQS